jgi:hypothetical protein
LDDLADDRDKPKRDDWSNLFLEIGADSFDLFFCHNSDIDTYLSNIWLYVTRWVPKIQSRHFVRYFCMFQYWKHILNKREEQLKCEISRRIIAKAKKANKVDWDLALY